MHIPASAIELALFAILRSLPPTIMFSELESAWSTTGLRREDLNQALWRMRERGYLKPLAEGGREWFQVTRPGRRAMTRKPTSPRAWLRFWQDSWLLWTVRNRPWQPAHSDEFRRGEEQDRPPLQVPRLGPSAAPTETLH